jgi:sugar phosphate isomerase/epimerase
MDERRSTTIGVRSTRPRRSPPPIAGARKRVADALGILLPYARAAGVPLAIEPLHPMYAADRACINTLAQANDLCDTLGPGIGIAVDVYHVWWDPDLDRQIARAGKDRLLAFHVCDWLVPTKDLLNDRGMMGDGVIDIRRMRGLVEAQGYEGFCEVEIFSSDWWSKPAETVLATCRERYATAC